MASTFCWRLIPIAVRLAFFLGEDVDRGRRTIPCTDDRLATPWPRGPSHDGEPSSRDPTIPIRRDTRIRNLLFADLLRVTSEHLFDAQIVVPHRPMHSGLVLTVYPNTKAATRQKPRCAEPSRSISDYNDVHLLDFFAFSEYSALQMRAGQEK